MKNPRAIKATQYLGTLVGEHRLQVLVLSHLDYHAVRNVYWFAVPNAARRSPALASRMKAEGMKAGVADLCIMFDEGRVAWLELKTAKGVQSPAQKNFEEICHLLGHRYGVAHTLDEAIAVLKAWGALK